MTHRHIKQALITPILACFISEPISLAHGESQPGPHNGFIRMPGTYHTELVMDQPTATLQIYILDMNFKPLNTDQAEIHAFYTQDKAPNQRQKLPCAKRGSFFACKAREIRLDSGTIFVQSKLRNENGKDVAYALSKLPTWSGSDKK